MVTAFALQRIVFIAIHKGTAIAYADLIILYSEIMIRVTLIDDILLIHRNIDYLRQLVYEEISLVPQLIGGMPGDLYAVYLLIYIGDLLRYGIDSLHLGLYLQVYALLKICEVIRHSIKILGQGFRSPNEGYPRGIGIGVLLHLRKSRIEILRINRLKAVKGIGFLEIILDLARIELVHRITPNVGLIRPVLHIQIAVSQLVYGIYRNSHSGHSVAGIGPQGALRRLVHHLLGISVRVDVRYVVCGGILGCLIGCKSGITDHQSRKL